MKTKMNRKISSIVLGVMMLLLAGGAVNASNQLPLEAYGLNTVAGYTTFLRTSKTIPNASILFDVKKPSGEVVNLSAVTNVNGVAQTQFSDYHTSLAGLYEVSARFENGADNGRFGTFEVYPSDVSVTKSTIFPADQVTRTAGEVAYLSVKLVDEYGNGVDGHMVRLISSSSADEVDVLSDNGMTDSKGEVRFRLSSGGAGPVTYSAYDATADVTVNQKAKIVYFGSSDYVFGYSSVAASSGNSSAPAKTLKFEDLPSSIGLNETITFKLSALDSSDEVTTSYRGTVRFSVVEGNGNYVDLPEDYTYVADDLGEHTFSLVMSFKQNGTYKVEVRDIDDVEIFGEQEFIVGASSGSAPDGNAGIVVTNPIAGTYSNNIHVVSGTATAGSQVKIFDNDLPIGDTAAGINGAFSFTTGQLADGVHKIYAAQVNDIGTIVDASSTIELIIDSTGAEITQVVLDPAGNVDPGSTVKIKLYVSEVISKATLNFNSRVFDMSMNAGGYYETDIAAPIEFGDYNLSFTLKDQLGNNTDFEDKAVLKVGPNLDQPMGVLLGDVSGLAATTSDGRVTLNWSAPAVNAFLVKNYRVYYGISADQLTEAVDTFTPSTTWYIPNLHNGVMYYIAVVAVDEQGNISPHFSNIVSAIPNPAVANVPSADVLGGTAGGEALNDMEKDASESGPEMAWLLVLSILGGGFYSYSSRKRLREAEEFDTIPLNF
ncbi:MAG: hypothetical protein V1679_02280 [Candidatus Peregrinibacteria bacterium]